MDDAVQGRTEDGFVAAQLASIAGEKNQSLYPLPEQMGLERERKREGEGKGGKRKPMKTT